MFTISSSRSAPCALRRRFRRGRTDHPANRPAESAGVETALAGEAGGARRGTLPATVRIPNEQLRVVSAPVAGMIEQLAVAPGDSVRRGQVLARLASPQALELQRDALQASAQATLQQQNLKRDEQLFAEGLIAESRLQATRAAAAQATAQAGERRQVRPGRPRTRQAWRRTGPDGAHRRCRACPGRGAWPTGRGAASIYRIAKLAPLWLEVQAPFAIASSLREGMPIKLADRSVTGKLVAIGRTIDTASQSVLLRVEVGAGAETLRPGQAVAVEITAADAKPRIPAAAVSRSEGVPVVFVQVAADDSGARFVARPVRVLGQSGDGVIVDGLGADERIAIKGVSGLKAIFSGVGKE